MSIATPTIISRDVPPKNRAQPAWTSINFTTTAGNTATIARKIEPGKVICDMIESKILDVSVPGLIPGIKPPLLFKSSAILFVGTGLQIEVHELKLHYYE